MKVDVTQYIKPNGRQVSRTVEIDDKCKGNYAAILSCHARLTVEQLITEQVSQAVECEDFDFDIILTSGADGDENKTAMETMILRFDKDECIKQQAMMD